MRNQKIDSFYLSHASLIIFGSTTATLVYQIVHPILYPNKIKLNIVENSWLVENEKTENILHQTWVRYSTGENAD